MTTSNQQQVNLNALVEQLTTNQYEPSVDFCTRRVSESSSQIILTSDNLILGIPANTYFHKAYFY
ncbi:unnamed protein product [Trichogramma brassicae]|uniref:Uncharacterized protein n=1 Tax=Trichogramma brassicae TaxID=86971 RepID=A0A6H5J6S5_9HYME|nr:unnamed protein product [Trichogramma brassicae]